jgi:redox-sensitive bicupin YhaK (pirin superfamily)
MIQVRKSEDRGHANHGWLDSRHTFSFADYHDPAHMGFRALRVINEDFVAASKGFPTHPHRDMEIVTYVLEGELEHKDSLGNGSKILPGDVQRMTAGTGVFHSEFNGSPTEQVHLLQIWILPESAGLKPSYEQKHFSEAEKQGAFKLVAARDGRAGSVTVHQDVQLFAGRLAEGNQVALPLARGRHAWVHVARGKVRLNGLALGAGDAAQVSDEQLLSFEGVGDSEVLVFDLA